MSYQAYFKQGLSLTLCGLLLTTASAASAADYECFKASTSEKWIKNRIPQGNWNPVHDTRKWNYDAIPGADIFRHRNGKRTVGTLCKRFDFNHGTLKIDFDGYQDWCVKHVPATTGSIVTPYCSSGYTLSANKKTCTKAAIAGYWKKNRIPQGNWNPVHDTRKWSYDAVPGADIFRHRNGRRTVGTLCKRFDFNHGTLKVDFDGYQDWCANYINGTPAHTVSASCPSGHALRVKPTNVNISYKSPKVFKKETLQQIKKPLPMHNYKIR